ncbi:beta-1,3-glucosidase [Colletotrichum graminicola]|nr:beta-1,3-glucosidase [Colletotrichum graminicola]
MQNPNFCTPPPRWIFRPKGIHTKHLPETDRIRIRTLYFDAYMPPKATVKQTGYTLSQVRHAVRANSAAVKPRSGRPRKPKQDQEKAEFK